MVRSGTSITSEEKTLRNPTSPPTSLKLYQMPPFLTTYYCKACYHDELRQCKSHHSAFALDHHNSGLAWFLSRCIRGDTHACTHTHAHTDDVSRSCFFLRSPLSTAAPCLHECWDCSISTLKSKQIRNYNNNTVEM